jgi:4-hydroxybutyrate CoA-transferase
VDVQSLERAATTLLQGLERATLLAAMSPQLPVDLVRALIDHAGRNDVRLTLLVADLTGRWDFVGDAAMPQLHDGRLRPRLLAGGVPARLSAHVDQVAASMWDVDRMIARGDLAIDIFVARVSSGLAPGYVSYGDMVGYSPAAVGTSARVGWEYVADAPRRPATPEVALDRALVIVDGGRYEAGARADSAVSADQHAVARRVARLVPDGATLQTGLGAIPGALFGELAGKQDLGVHSGILPGGLQDLIATGVVNGARKKDEPGRHVATGVLGGNPGAWGPDVLLEPLSRTHDPSRLLALDRLWAVNSAFEVDLWGQVNAEYVAGLRVASGGGQVDFMRAAHLSDTGAAVLALPSRTPRGEPRIVPRLPDRHLPTLSGADLDFVVTDQGVARLTGLSLTERALALIEVAHPDDRVALRRDWEDCLGPVPGRAAAVRG